MRVSHKLYNFIKKMKENTYENSKSLAVRDSVLIYGQSKIYFEKGQMGDFPDSFMAILDVPDRHELVAEMQRILPDQFAEAVVFNRFIPDYPTIQEGDIVISTTENSCDIRLVESAEDESIVLVNGIQNTDLIGDEALRVKNYYTLPDELSKFWSDWKILCRKEDRKDISL